MEEIIAYCGITCTECPAYLATQIDDDEERAQVAERWSAEFLSEIKPEDINCDGCLAGHERYFSHCYKCEIRACGIARGVENCAHCDQYACEKLDGFLDMVPGARTELDRIHAGRE